MDDLRFIIYQIQIQAAGAAISTHKIKYENHLKSPSPFNYVQFTFYLKLFPPIILISNSGCSKKKTGESWGLAILLGWKFTRMTSTMICRHTLHIYNELFA
jgi:hypothetical protein